MWLYYMLPHPSRQYYGVLRSVKAPVAIHTIAGWQEAVWGIVTVRWVAVPDVWKEHRAFNRHTVGTDMRCK
jgi:hypothetical protein